MTPHSPPQPLTMLHEFNPASSQESPLDPTHLGWQASQVIYKLLNRAVAWSLDPEAPTQLSEEAQHAKEEFEQEQGRERGTVVAVHASSEQVEAWNETQAMIEQLYDEAPHSTLHTESA